MRRDPFLLFDLYLECFAYLQGFELLSAGKKISCWMPAIFYVGTFLELAGVIRHSSLLLLEDCLYFRRELEIWARLVSFLTWFLGSTAVALRVAILLAFLCGWKFLLLVFFWELYGIVTVGLRAIRKRFVIGSIMLLVRLILHVFLQVIRADDFLSILGKIREVLYLILVEFQIIKRRDWRYDILAFLTLPSFPNSAD